MDTFIDKLAQKTVANDIINANTAAEARESQRIKDQLAGYEELLQEMKQVNLKNIEAASKVSDMLGEAGSLATRDAGGAEVSKEMIDAAKASSEETLREVRSASQETVSAVKTASEDMVAASMRSSEKAIAATNSSKEEIIAAFKENSDNVKESIDSLKRSADDAVASVKRASDDAISSISGKAGENIGIS